MFQITLKIQGMMCGMCESHINDAIRQAFPVKKVTSSHTKGETVILAEVGHSQKPAGSGHRKNRLPADGSQLRAL